MTDKEKAIVMAYTGVCMLAGDKYSIFHQYIQELMGRPVYTHELARKDIQKQIEDKSRADFLRLCEDEDND